MTQTDRPYLFPLGPLDALGDTPFGIFVCRDDGGTEKFWGADWDSALREAEIYVGQSDWVTLPWLADEVPMAAGRGALDLPDTLAPLAWAIGNLADPAGFTGRLHVGSTQELMAAMGTVSVLQPLMTEGQSQPFHLDIMMNGSVDRFTGAFDLADDVITLMITRSKDHMRKIYETSFGADLPEDVPMMMGQIIGDHGGAIGHATGALYGGGFKPLIRSRLKGGPMGPMENNELQMLTLAFSRMPGLMQGVTISSGTVSLTGQDIAVEMYRIDID